MCSDLVYVILFPQLLMVVHFKHHCNTYGSLSAYIVAFLVRLTGGEEMLGLPPMIHYPGWDGERQLFPFRTLAMIMSLVTLIGVSWGTKYVILLIQKYYFCILVVAAQGKPDVYMFITSNRSIAVNNTYGSSVVVSSEVLFVLRSI